MDKNRFRGALVLFKGFPMAPLTAEERAAMKETFSHLLFDAVKVSWLVPKQGGGDPVSYVLDEQGNPPPSHPSYAQALAEYFDLPFVVEKKRTLEGFES